MILKRKSILFLISLTLSQPFKERHISESWTTVIIEIPRMCLYLFIYEIGKKALNVINERRMKFNIFLAS